MWPTRISSGVTEVGSYSYSSPLLLFPAEDSQIGIHTHSLLVKFSISHLLIFSQFPICLLLKWLLESQVVPGNGVTEVGIVNPLPHGCHLPQL